MAFGWFFGGFWIVFGGFLDVFKGNYFFEGGL